MNNTQHNINICLFKLSGKDQAAVERVIQFSISQGKQYVLWAELEGANIVVANDTESLGDLPAIIVYVGDQAGKPDCLVLHPPLLVSRVMRMIDKAVSMHASLAVAAIETDIPGVQSAVAEKNIEPEDKAESAEKNRAAVEKLKAEDSAVTNAQIETVEKPEIDGEDGATEKAKSFTALKAKDKAGYAEVIKVADTLEAEEKTAQKAQSKPEVEALSGQFIALVVDDSAAIRKQLELELRIAKIKADFAETGEEALEKSAQKNYDLVFLDIVMPGIDGYEVCKQMRLRDSMKKTPIVMLSGKTSPLDEVQGVIAGASTYLTKPVKHEMFQKTLNRLSTWLSDYSR